MSEKANPLTQLSFRYPFRKYQRMILEQVASGRGDRKYHIVAPPGAGKTIVGIELIRRFGQSAVVFAPTTTIQEQWREKVGLFLPEDASVETMRTLVSTDPHHLCPINIFTYQLISTPGESRKYVQEMARRRWVEDLIVEGQVESEDEGWGRLETMRRHNPRSYRRELSRRYQRIKRELLRREDVDIRPFLHPNARQLIADLVAYGVRTVVLDECHHLLDYWAIVLRHLIGQITSPRVVGLTATLPSPEDEHAYENYTTLLGEVDFEVPTPAVVKEGDLAPYRDLVYFVEPTKREMAYLRNIQQAFEGAIAELTEQEHFRRWVEQTIVEGPYIREEPLPWSQFLRKRPTLAVAGVRFLLHIGYTFPPEMVLPAEADEPMTLDDWAALLERYGLDVLRVSPNPDDHARFQRLREILLPFGLTLTERGLRQGRSPGDLVLTFSEAKDAAVAEILAAEMEAMGERLRAVVVTDFERMSSGVRRLDGVLDRDAGSAYRLFHHLVTDPRAGQLDPILVTGRTVLVDADHGPGLLEMFNNYLRNAGLKATCHYEPAKVEHAMKVAGVGPDWTSRTYVRMITDLFEAGVTRCLVGTRGIFGEGWDSLSLNTLIDLTSVTTSTSVQQLRGRTIRLDPAWPRKVAHNWDVVCVAKKFERGDVDLRRLVRRHQRYWGIVMVPAATRVAHQAARATEQAVGHLLAPLTGTTSPQPSKMHGQIVKGLAHVDLQLAFALAVRGFKKVNYRRFTRRMMAQIPLRDQVYDLWGIGEAYSNFSYSATRLDTRDLKIRTVFTVQRTLLRMLRAFLASVLMGIFTACLVSLNIAVQLSPLALQDIRAVPVGCTAISLVMALGTLLTFLLNARQAYRLGKAMLVEQPPDGILLDVGRALLLALRDAGLVSRHLQPDYVRVVEQPDGSYDVLLDYASPEEASLFIEAYRQIFEPVRDQRYIILRDDTRLPNLPLRVLWAVVRRIFRNAGLYKPAYHPVPKILAVRRELAETFARYWQRYVGGGRLVYTRSDEGRRLLLQARAQRRPKVKGMAFEIWR